MGFPQILVLTGMWVGGTVSPQRAATKGLAMAWGHGMGMGWGAVVVFGFLCHVKVEALTHLIVMMSDLVNGHGPQGDSDLPWPMGRPFPRRGALQAIRFVVIMPALMAGALGLRASWE